MIGIEVKALEWREHGNGWFADRYCIWKDAGDPDLYIVSGWTSGTNPYDTLEAAFAAAQSDFDARIRSALIERKAEPVAWRWRLRGAQVWIYDPSSEWLDKHCADQDVEIEPLYSTLPAVPTPTPAMIEAAWQAYQDCPVDLCGDHDEEQKKSVVAALCAALSASPSPVCDHEWEAEIPFCTKCGSTGDPSPSPVGESRDGLIERLTDAVKAEILRSAAMLRPDELSVTVGAAIRTALAERNDGAIYPFGDRDNPAFPSTPPAEPVAAQAGWQLVPKDDDRREFSDSALPAAMISAGADVLEKASEDLRNYVAGETIDWDYGMEAVAVYRAMLSASPSPGDSRELVERLEDKIEGLQADLDSAVEVAYRRGAAEWTRLNYPDHFKRLSAAKEQQP